MGSQGMARRPRMVVGRPAHVAIAPLLCPIVVVVELKREIVEGKGGMEGEGGRPAILGLHSIPIFIIHFILLLSCLLHWPKASKVKQIPFTLFQNSFYLFLKYLDFILCNDETNMLWKWNK
jgi:hypothetical protein